MFSRISIGNSLTPNYIERMYCSCRTGCLVETNGKYVKYYCPNCKKYPDQLYDTDYFKNLGIKIEVKKNGRTRRN